MKQSGTLPQIQKKILCKGRGGRAKPCQVQVSAPLLHPVKSWGLKGFRNLLWLDLQESKVTRVPPCPLKAQPGLKGERNLLSPESGWGQPACALFFRVWCLVLSQAPPSYHTEDRARAFPSVLITPIYRRGNEEAPGKISAPYTELRDTCATRALRPPACVTELKA